MLVGMAAGGLLIIRSLLVWSADPSPYRFGVDIPIAAVVLALWAGAAAILLVPPRAVLARPDGANASSALVWPLGRRFRFWTVIAAPLCGLLAAIAPVTIPIALGWDPEIPVNLWLGLPLSVALTAFAVALVWIVLRGAWHGVETTPTHLIARGYFVTRRFPRDAIISVSAVRLKWWPHVILSMLMNRDVDYAVQLSLSTGLEPLLYAATSQKTDVELGAEMVWAWRQSVA